MVICLHKTTTVAIVQIIMSFTSLYIVLFLHHLSDVSCIYLACNQRIKLFVYLFKKKIKHANYADLCLRRPGSRSALRILEDASVPTARHRLQNACLPLHGQILCWCSGVGFFGMYRYLVEVVDYHFAMCFAFVGVLQH